MKEYNENLEKNLLDMIKQKEEVDKRLLTLEIFISVLVLIIFLSLVFVASFVNMEDWLRVLLIVIGFIPFVIGMSVAIRIEQIAGYYECKECKNRYIPTYSSVLWAMHVNRTRYMKCPECKKWSWNKKVISKD